VGSRPGAAATLRLVPSPSAAPATWASWMMLRQSPYSSTSVGSWASAWR
jgi:hypothetical protein